MGQLFRPRLQGHFINTSQFRLSRHAIHLTSPTSILVLFVHWPRALQSKIWHRQQRDYLQFERQNGKSHVHKHIGQ